jgi:hypothetical protein
MRRSRPTPTGSEVIDLDRRMPARCSSQIPVAASTRRAAASGFSTISHSHRRTTVQPCSPASAVARTSLACVAENFACHIAAFGPAGFRCGQCRGHPCQKSPSTNTAIRRRGRTRSGLQPFAIRRCKRKRAPSRCRAFRNRISGFVSFDLRPLSCPLRAVLTQPTSPTADILPRARPLPSGVFLVARCFAPTLAVCALRVRVDSL